MLWNEHTVRTFRTILALFLDPQRITTLQNVLGISASSASRFVSCQHTTDEVLWQPLKSVKYDFGLREARLRTPGGICLWVFFACLAYSLASFAQHRAAKPFTLSKAAVRVCDEVLEDVRLFQLMVDCERFSLGRRRRVKVVAV